jgi:hypothetical protein
MLIDSQGMVLTCPFLPTGTFLNQELVSHVTSSTPGWVTARDDGHNGRNSIIGFAPAVDTSAITQYSTGKQWHAFIRQDPHELYAPIRALLLSVSLSGVGLIGFVAFLRLVLYQTARDAIQILTMARRRSARGNLDVRLEFAPTTRSAIGRRFNGWKSSKNPRRSSTASANGRDNSRR